MRKIKVGNKLIGEGQPCFIIAEAGVNHNGDIVLAKKLIDVAVESRVDAVKFQTFKSENLVTGDLETEKYQKENFEEKNSQLEMLKKLELSHKDFEELKKYCDEKNIIFLSTPYDEEAADFLENLGVLAFKVGSGELTHLPLLKHIAKKKLPIIISSGASYLDEVKEAVKCIKTAGNDKIVLLHCTSRYPTPLEDVNLRVMSTLKKVFKLSVGYSDHTIGILVPAMATALGATVLEKHFTLDKNAKGPDHKASLDPKELKEMVASIRNTEKALGSCIKIPVKSETEERKLGWRSLIARIEIPKGAIIKKEMIIIKRPGMGIRPKDMGSVIGQKAKNNIKKDTLIKYKDLE